MISKQMNSGFANILIEYFANNDDSIHQKRWRSGIQRTEQKVTVLDSRQTENSIARPEWCVLARNRYLWLARSRQTYQARQVPTGWGVSADSCSNFEKCGRFGAHLDNRNRASFDCWSWLWQCISHVRGPSISTSWISQNKSDRHRHTRAISNSKHGDRKSTWDQRFDRVSRRKISETDIAPADITIALHACDTATDDAIAWAIKNNSKLLLIAPCCHHDLQTQLVDVPEPWSIVTKHGILKERLGDILTDALRAQILRLRGYRTEIIEFVGDEHTPRNLMIRAVKTGALPDETEIKRYREMLNLWKIHPKLAKLIQIPE